MNSSFPASVTFEIDRERLRKYLRARSLLGWVIPVVFFGTLFGLLDASERLKKSELPPAEKISRAMADAGIGAAIGFSVAGVGYLLCHHRYAGRMARTLDVSVDGPFLCIREQGFIKRDHKLHFRSIVDYSTQQGPLMSFFGVHALQMSTTSGGVGSALVVHGIKDSLKVRDILCEIDRERECQ